jgi:hypothetical protein
MEMELLVVGWLRAVSNLSIYLPCNSHALKQGKVKEGRYLSSLHVPISDGFAVGAGRGTRRRRESSRTWCLFPNTFLPGLIHQHTTMSHVSLREQSRHIR